MRRWLLILFVAILPLQFSWAAVASYCAHEEPSAKSHQFGHHEYVPHGASDHKVPHGHTPHGQDAAKAKADVGDKSKTDGTSSAAVSLDCGHCHGHCTGMVDLSSKEEPRLLDSVPPSLGDARCAEHVPAQPERPQWARLA